MISTLNIKIIYMMISIFLCSGGNFTLIRKKNCLKKKKQKQIMLKSRYRCECESVDLLLITVVCDAT